MTRKVSEKEIDGRTVEIREHKEYKDSYPNRKRKYDIYIDGEIDLEKRVNNHDRQNPEGLFDVAERRISAMEFEQKARSTLENEGLVKHQHGGYGFKQDSNVRFVIGSSSMGENIGEHDQMVRVLERKVKRKYKYKSMPQRTKPKSWQKQKTFRDLTELSEYINKNRP